MEEIRKLGESYLKDFIPSSPPLNRRRVRRRSDGGKVERTLSISRVLSALADLMIIYLGSRIAPDLSRPTCGIGFRQGTGIPKKIFRSLAFLHVEIAAFHPRKTVRFFRTRLCGSAPAPMPRYGRANLEDSPGTIRSGLIRKMGITHYDAL